MTYFVRLFAGACLLAFLLLWITGVAGCTQLEARSECDATPGVKVSLGDGGWRVRPTLGC